MAGGRRHLIKSSVYLISLALHIPHTLHSSEHITICTQVCRSTSPSPQTPSSSQFICTMCRRRRLLTEAPPLHASFRRVQPAWRVPKVSALHWLRCCCPHQRERGLPAAWLPRSISCRLTTVCLYSSRTRRRWPLPLREPTVNVPLGSRHAGAPKRVFALPVQLLMHRGLTSASVSPLIALRLSGRQPPNKDSACELRWPRNVQRWLEAAHRVSRY